MKPNNKMLMYCFNDIHLMMIDVIMYNY